MLDFIAKHKYGIIGTLVFHFLLLLYFNLNNIDVSPYQKKTPAILELDYRQEDTKDENIDELEQEIEELEKQLTDQELYEKINNMMRDANYKPENASKNNSSNKPLASEKTIEEQLEEKYRKLEQEIISQREKEGKHFDRPEDKTTNPETPTDNPNNGNQQNSQPAGPVAGTCDVPGRQCRAAKIPSYRCKSSGKIHVDIKVNQKGRITSAKVNTSLSTSSNECLINESLKYAKRLWVNQDFTGPNSVDGSVTYIFVGQ